MRHVRRSVRAYAGRCKGSFRYAAKGTCMPKATHMMHAETIEQPQAVARMLSEQAGAIGDVVAALRRRSPSMVVFVARGTSHNAAIYGQYLVETLLRIPTSTAMPSVTTLYGRTPNWTNAAV